MTKTVGAFEAKTHLSSLLDDVERGEVITITKHGRPVARLVPLEHGNAERIEATIALIKQRRAGRRLDGVDWKVLRDEGRR